jgi:hypothetical protein
MSNLFAVLNDSDDDEKPVAKVARQVTKPTDGKKADSAPASSAPAKASTAKGTVTDYLSCLFFSHEQRGSSYIRVLCDRSILPSQRT